MHDTSQVTGSALVFAEVFSLPRALDVATVTKLVRNVFTIAVIPLMTLYYATDAGLESEVRRERFRLAELLPLWLLDF